MATRYAHLGAFESTKIHGSHQDVLGTTRHIERWRHDLDLLLEAGIRELRYSVPWHRIEHTPGTWDWHWMDGPMQHFARNGMRPILDPLHHTSFPDWLTDGFANPQFPELYERFLTQFAHRYPWADRYTVFNEPLPTVLFCSYTGMWYPYGSSDPEFVDMSVNVSKAICRASSAVLKINSQARFVHIDTCEHHQALDKRSEPWVRFANQRRFLLHDLALGRIDTTHELLPYLQTHGLREDDRLWLADHPTRFDVLGLDYYHHSEIDWYWDQKLRRANIRFPCERPLGFALVARQYAERYPGPVMLSETNIRGSVTDRLTWLKFMEEQCQQLSAGGIDVTGFCWYPSIDSTDWCHCCTKCTYSVDPQGIWWLDNQRWNRHASELSEWYAKLARGEACAQDLPAYRFTPPLNHDLQGYLRLMRHWTVWQQPEGLPGVA